MWSIIVEKAIELAVEKSLSSSYQFLRGIKIDKLDLTRLDLPNRFKSHYTEILKWSFVIPFAGLNKGKTLDNTIQLDISSKISRYGPDNNEYFISESELLTTRNNIIIIGKPGAGKTTTVKRLLYTLIIDYNNEFPFTSPILVRLRNMKNGGNLFAYILNTFNIETENRNVVEIIEKKGTDGKVRKIEEKIIKYYVKNTDELVLEFISNFLNFTNSIVFIDGFDEIPIEEQRKVLSDVKDLGLKLSNAKIILTSRTSSINNIIVESFEVYELKPIDREDVVIISKKWLGDNSIFVKELYKKPYCELANRPIYLSLLLVLFEKTQTLPTRALDIYREAVYLIIRDWDESRQITRHSKYTDFNVHSKLLFLQELAFFLTYKINSNVFSSTDLIEIYNNIYGRYNLPKEEVYDVISEIESHNGLISEVGYKIFEFSHLTLQEYLCAEYLVTLPFNQSIARYFIERPDPIAIAISLSRDSGVWFANLILNEHLNISKVNGITNFGISISKLLIRLLDESPIFNISFELGAVIIYLVSKFQKNENIIELICKLLVVNNVSNSLHLALKYYKIELRSLQHIYILKRIEAVNTDSFIRIPFNESILAPVWRQIEMSMNKNLT
jgi:predicted NACHT family NTPase